MVKKKILFIDDNTAIQDIVKQTFDSLRRNMVLASALTAEEGLDLLNEADCTLPDLILLDLNLPAMSGAEFLEKIKQDKKLQEIPVIVLTATEDENELQKLLDIGALKCYSKPYDFYSFTSLVENIIEEQILTPQHKVFA